MDITFRYREDQSMSYPFHLQTELNGVIYDELDRSETWYPPKIAPLYLKLDRYYRIVARDLGIMTCYFSGGYNALGFLSKNDAIMFKMKFNQEEAKQWLLDQ